MKQHIVSFHCIREINLFKERVFQISEFELFSNVFLFV